MQGKRVSDYVSRSVALIIKLMIFWALVSYGFALFARPLSAVPVLTGFPLSYWIAAQVSVVTFIVLLFINAVKMDRLDQEYVGQTRGPAGRDLPSGPGAQA